MELTRILKAANSDRKAAREQLILAAYARLKEIAAARMYRQNVDHTLTATALVNELSLKLLSESRLPVVDGQQFLAYASAAMRNLLIDHARRKKRVKRGRGVTRLSFRDAVDECERHSAEVLELNDWLDELALIKPRHARVVEMKYFGGMTNEEIATAVGTSTATVKRDWTLAKVWLKCQLSR